MNIHMKNHACKDFVESHKKRVWLKTHMSRQNLQVKSKAVKASPKNNKQTNNNQFVNSSCSFSIRTPLGIWCYVVFCLWHFSNFGPLLIFWIAEPILNIQTDLCSAQRVLSEKYKLFWLLSQLKIPCGIAIWRLCSMGTQHKNLHQMSVTMSRVTHFILRADTGTCISHS